MKAAASGGADGRSAAGRGSKRDDRQPAPAKGAHAPSGSKQAATNDLLPFLEFVERHPVGSQVEATIESYSSHGAYSSVGSVKAYLPLRYLADPPPRSARDVVAIGERRPFVVASFHAGRRGIDLAVPGVKTDAPLPLPSELEPAPAKKAAKRPAKAAKTAKATKATKAAKAAKGTEVPADLDAAGPADRAEKTTRTRKKAAAAADTGLPTAPAPAARTTKRAAKKSAAVEPIDLVEPPMAVDDTAAPVPATTAPAKKAAKSRKKAAAPATPDALPSEQERAAPAAKKAARPRKAAAASSPRSEPAADAGAPTPAPSPVKASRARKKAVDPVAG